MAYTYRHDKTQVSYGKESTWGTGTVGSIWFGHVQSHDPDWSWGFEAKRYVGSNNRTVDDFYEMATDYAGKIEFFPQDGRLLQYAFGKDTDSGGPVYVHTIVESGALPSFTLYDAYISATASNAGNVLKRADGCKIDTLEISGRSGEPVTMTVDYIAKTGSIIASGAAPSVTASTSKVYMSEMAHLADVTGGAMSAENIGELTEFTITVKNNLQKRGYLDNSRNVGALETAAADYEFKFKADARETTANDIFDSLYQAGSSFVADLYLFRTSGSDQMQFWMSGARIIDANIPTKVEPGVVELDLTVVPKTMGVIVKDAIATY